MYVCLFGFGGNSFVVQVAQILGFPWVQAGRFGTSDAVGTVRQPRGRDSPSHTGCSPDHEPSGRQVRSAEPRSW